MLWWKHGIFYSTASCFHLYRYWHLAEIFESVSLRWIFHELQASHLYEPFEVQRIDWGNTSLYAITVLFQYTQQARVQIFFKRGVDKKEGEGWGKKTFWGKCWCYYTLSKCIHKKLKHIYSFFLSFCFVFINFINYFSKFKEGATLITPLVLAMLWIFSYDCGFFFIIWGFIFIIRRYLHNNNLV